MLSASLRITFWLGVGLGYGGRGRGAESGYSSPVDLARAAGGIPPFGQYGGK